MMMMMMIIIIIIKWKLLILALYERIIYVAASLKWKETEETKSAEFYFRGNNYWSKCDCYYQEQVFHIHKSMLGGGGTF
jgi:hypothetical protein